MNKSSTWPLLIIKTVLLVAFLPVAAQAVTWTNYFTIERIGNGEGSNQEFVIYIQGRETAN